MKFGVYGFNTIVALTMILVCILGWNDYLPFGVVLTITLLCIPALAIGLTYAIDRDAERSAKRIIAERERESKSQ